MKNSILKALSLTSFLMFILIACEEDNTGPFDIRDDFTGSWLCEENSQVFGQTTYTVNITKSSNDSTKIFISNFYQLGTSQRAEATVNGNNLTIPSQTIDGHNVTGSGTLIGTSQINMSYTVNDGGGTDNVTATYTQ